MCFTLPSQPKKRLLIGRILTHSSFPSRFCLVLCAGFFSLLAAAAETVSFSLPDGYELELYDLENDPWEFHNLAGKAEYAEIEQRMKTALKTWRHETDDPALDPAWHDQVMQEVTSRARR